MHQFAHNSTHLLDNGPGGEHAVGAGDPGGRGEPTAGGAAQPQDGAGARPAEAEEQPALWPRGPQLDADLLGDGQLVAHAGALRVAGVSARRACGSTANAD